MIVALNNKSNFSKEEFLAYQEKLKNIQTNITLILCPTFLNINLFSLENIHLGSQNVSAKDPGPYTGEISAKHLKASHVEYAIVGHSDIKDSAEVIQEKIKRLFEQKITPILCIGETKEERMQNNVEEVLRNRLENIINGLTEEEKEKIIIVYEPVWAIGADPIPTVNQIEEACRILKTIVPKNVILYGGNANEKNIDSLKTSPLIEGYLLGGLSLKPEELQIFINKLENR